MINSFFIYLVEGDAWTTNLDHKALIDLYEPLLQPWQACGYGFEHSQAKIYKWEKDD